MPFHTKLVLEDLQDGDHWVVTEPLIWSHLETGTFTVPAGFITDLASVPKWLQIFYQKEGTYDRVAVLHDWLCAQVAIKGITALTREEADEDFKLAMADSGVNKLTIVLFYLAVRMYSTSKISKWETELG